jgi:hypothetical protein
LIFTSPLLPFAPVVEPEPPEVPPVVAAVVPPVLPWPVELSPPELPWPPVLDVDAVPLVPVDVPPDVPPVVLVEVPPVVVVLPDVPVDPPFVAALHGPWLRLNCPLQLEAIIALAPVTVDPRLRVVV